MHSSTAIAILGSLASASVLPREDTTSPSFKLESRLANGTSMGYVTAVVSGGGWAGALVDDISEAKNFVLTDHSSQKASLMLPKDPSDGFSWDLGWWVGEYESDQQEYVGLVIKENGQEWTTGFSINSQEDNLLKYDGPRSPLHFGACRGVGFVRGQDPQTALYWRIPGSHPRTWGCADFALHAIFD